MISKVIKLIKIVKSAKDKKKYDAHFLLDNGKIKISSFGQSGARDFTLINDKSSPFYLNTMVDRNKVKSAYYKRHYKRENKLWNSSPMSPAALSKLVLWNKPTLKESIKYYKDKFKL